MPRATKAHKARLPQHEAPRVGYHDVSRGSLDTTVVHPREVFRAAILANAAAVTRAR